MADEPPTIAEGVRQILTVIGNNVSIVCRARGAPRPQLTWFKNGYVDLINKNLLAL